METLFLDESGGPAPGHSHQVLSAVKISSQDADRVMRRFRKEIKLQHEIKGHYLHLADRRMFFESSKDILSGATHSVILDTRSALGQWAQQEIEPAMLWAYAVIEAATPLIGTATRLHIDGGRYSRHILDQVKPIIISETSSRTNQTVRAEFLPSQEHGGIQIADILSNSLYRAARGLDPEISSLLQDIAPCEPLQLDSLRPDWISPETAKPPRKERL